MRFLLLAPVSLAITAFSVTAQQPDSQRVAINRVFAPWTSTTGPGCAVGVSRNGIVIFENGYGMANLEHDVPIMPSTIFHVASVSKQFTAAAVMLLAGDGKLSLDDDIRKYLPEVPAYSKTITIRHLLQHTSGLRDQWDLLAMARGRFEEDRITEADVLEIVSRQKALNFEPGTEYLYSNTGFTLAGTIVRRVSGKSLREFADERIFRPLGMTQTHFHDDYTMIVRNRAAGYARRASDWRVSLPNYDTYGATSLFTTVGDLLRWTANFDRPTVGSQAMLRELQQSGVLLNGDTTAYGLGIGIGLHRGARVVSHGGSDAGYRTYLGRFPEHGLAIAVLCNASTANPSALAMQVADVVLRDKLSFAEAPVSPPVTLPADRLARYAGVYAHPVTGAPLFITLRRDTLVVGRVNGPVLVPLAEGRFRASGAPVEFSFNSPNSLTQTFHAWPPRQPVTFVRQTTPNAVVLRDYAGTYYSEELGATYVVTATDSTLSLKTRMGEAVTVRPAYGEVFDGGFLLRFVRDAGGKVTGFLASTGRVRNVRFQRSSGAMP